MKQIRHMKRYMVHFHNFDETTFDYHITKAFNKRQAFLKVKRMLPEYAIVRPEYVERIEE